MKIIKLILLLALPFIGKTQIQIEQLDLVSFDARVLTALTGVNFSTGTYDLYTALDSRFVNLADRWSLN